jgi:diguanylate cyclase (GGDEF)-like protein/PAS domain S-box-containing protein
MQFKDISQGSLNKSNHYADLFGDKNNLDNIIMANADLIVLAWKDPENLIKFNKYAQKITGFKEEEMLGNGWCNHLFDNNLKSFMTKTFEDPSKSIIIDPHETYIFDKAGNKINVFLKNFILYDKEKKPYIFISIGMDIPKRKIDEDKLSSNYRVLEMPNNKLSSPKKELNKRYEELKSNQEYLKEIEEMSRLAIEGSKDGIWHWKVQENKIYLSTRCKIMLGYKDEELDNKLSSWIKLIHKDDIRNFQQAMKKHLTKQIPFLNINVRMKTKVGIYKWISIRGKALFNDTNFPIRIAGSTTDITSHKKSEETVYKLAYYDNLTNLPNKTLFNLKLNNEIKKCLKYNTHIALLYMDLDNFKSINDTFGHYFGDKLLLEVAKSLNYWLRDNISISRLGGDEFMIIISNLPNIDYARSLAEKILKSLYTPFVIDKTSVLVTASIGIVLCPSDGSDIGTLLKNADAAMYHAKSLGKNNYQLFSKQLSDKLMEKVELEKTLRFALLNKKEKEFMVYYQPQVDTITSQLVGMEALVRWLHPTRGFISPSQFIPIAEETGLINEIDELVIRTTCKQLKKWEKQGYKLVPVSVNISANQFKHEKNIFDKVKSILQETDLSPKWLHIEITESATITDMNLTIKILNKFKAMGIKVLLDDFGTGYSSLNHLKNLPINTLKIDKSFIDQIAYKENERAIARTLIELAHILNMDVIAEGVETQAQLEVLKSQQCDKIQGYLFSKPLSPDKAEKLLSYNRLCIKI